MYMYLNNKHFATHYSDRSLCHLFKLLHLKQIFAVNQINAGFLWSSSFLPGVLNFVEYFHK